MEEWLKKDEERKNKIRNLVLSTLGELTKLECTYEEYDFFKSYMDIQTKKSKINF